VEKHNESTSLPKIPRNSPPEILQNVVVLKYFEEKRGNVRINVTLKRVLVTVDAVERKGVFNILPVSVRACVRVSVTLVIQHTNRMRCIVSSVICGIYGSAMHLFPHYLTNYTVSRLKLLSTKCVFCFSLQLLPETFLALRRIQQVTVINVHCSSCKVPGILRR
jgi:hypothetical protein